MKRGLVAFILVVLLAPALLALLSLERSLEAGRSAAVESVLSLERQRSFELEAKASLRTALASIPTTLTQEERARMAGGLVARWAVWLDSRGRALGLNLSVWCGAVDRNVLATLPENMIAQRSALAPSSAFSATSWLPDTQGRLVPACTALLDPVPAGPVVVSRGGFTRVPGLGVWNTSGWFLGLGVSVYSPAIQSLYSSEWASVFLFPEGFEGGYEHG